MSLRRWVLAGLVLAVVAAGAVVALKRQAPPVAAPPQLAVEPVLELTEADLFVVRGGEIGRALRANGSLRAARQAVVRAKIGGEIVDVPVREGDRVEAGQVIARIDRSEYESRYRERLASLEAAKAQAAFAETTRKKNEDLLQKKFISSQAYDNAKSGAEVGAAQADALKAQVDLAKKALDDTVVRAPIAGWVAERSVQRGDKTNVDGKLFTLVDLRTLELEALVPANEIAQVTIGQEFVASVEGFGERRFAGRVARVAPSAQSGNRNVPIYIEIDNKDAALKTGLFAEGRLGLGRKTAVALAPTSALRTEAGGSFVYVLAGDRIRKLPVDIGIVSEGDGLAEIARGLEPGAKVIAANLGTLKDGARFRIAGAPAAK